MKMLGKIVLTSLISFGALSTAAYADAAKGQKLYSKKLKEVCGMTGAVFAAKHTQMEWETAKNEGKLTDTFIEVCPAGSDIFKDDNFKKKYESHIYDFVIEFASDSGNVPSC